MNKRIQLFGVIIIDLLPNGEAKTVLIDFLRVQPPEVLGDVLQGF